MHLFTLTAIKVIIITVTTHSSARKSTTGSTLEAESPSDCLIGHVLYADSYQHACGPWST
jgi:hypothetical protein